MRRALWLRCSSENHLRMLLSWLNVVARSGSFMEVMAGRHSRMGHSSLATCASIILTVTPVVLPH
jgi:hypothetical protein